MASLIEELIGTLKKQMQNYEELLILSQEKKGIVIRNDIEMLQKITAAENTIIGRNQKLEHKRELCVKDIATVLNVNSKQLTITKIAELIKNQKEYSELVAIRDDLKKVLGDLKVKNDQNQALINSSLDYINFSVNAIRSGGNVELSYYSQGEEVVVNDGKNFFDAKQ